MGLGIVRFGCKYATVHPACRGADPCAARLPLDHHGPHAGTLCSRRRGCGLRCSHPSLTWQHAGSRQAAISLLAAGQSVGDFCRDRAHPALVSKSPALCHVAGPAVNLSTTLQLPLAFNNIPHPDRPVTAHADQGRGQVLGQVRLKAGTEKCVTLALLGWLCVLCCLSLACHAVCEGEGED